jgi:hypothetical protein
MPNNIEEVVVESKQDPREVAEQLFETLNKLELELTRADDLEALHDSYEIYSCGSESDESSWEQERIHPTMKFKYKPINLFFERKSTNKITTPTGKHAMMIQPQM